MEIPWLKYFPKNNEGICSEVVFCPDDYKNVAGWTNRVASVNDKYMANLVILQVPATVIKDMCGNHYKPITGHRQTQFYGCRNDYFCSKRRNCWKIETEIKANIIVICPVCTDIDTVKKQINGKSIFTIL